MIQSEKLIQLQKVCFAYDGRIALRGVTLDVEKGETIVLQGANGCGKTTLLKLLNGLVFAQEGTYLFDGKQICEKTMRDTHFAKWLHQQIGFVFQNADIQLFCASVEEEIAFGPRQMGLDKEEVRRRVEDVVSLFGLEKLRTCPPYHLSGGEKKKVSLACVMSMNPRVLVLDEPAAALDGRSQSWLTDFLLELKKSGKTMVLSTHQEQLAQKLADRIVRMNEEHGITNESKNCRKW